MPSPNCRPGDVPVRSAVLLACGVAAMAGPAIPASADVRITEIMYHPAHADGEREPTELEFIELENLSPTTTVPLTGWEIDDGVSFDFPARALAPGERIVVAADPAAVAVAYPGVPAASVLGPWTGSLNNSGERIRLVDAFGETADAVTYADEGDWAARARGPLHFDHRGWIWDAPHDGGGRSLELIDRTRSNNVGQNWAPSATAGGTPGALNSRDSNVQVPFLSNVRHEPIVPRASEPVTVRAEADFGNAAGPHAVSLHWRAVGEPAFAAYAMALGADGRWAAEIPGHGDRTVVEFYVRAASARGARTWPAETAGGGQQANALFQVDDQFDPLDVPGPGEQPFHRVVMTNTERAELATIGSTWSQAESNAEMNCTFISSDADGVRVRYLCSIRNRGASSRYPPPNNFLVKFRSDDAWNGLAAVKFNVNNTHSQVAGSWLFRRFGIQAAETVPAQLRINGSNLAPASGNPGAFGTYAMAEALDSEFASNHWPNDRDGNLYQVRDDNGPGELTYEGDDPDDYSDIYFKQTNQSAADYSDLIALTKTLETAPDAGYAAALEGVLDLDQWLRFIAVDALLGNHEGGLTTGKGDDYALYRGGADPRFVLVPHDYDTLIGVTPLSAQTNRSIFVYAGVEGLARMLSHPDIVPRFFQAFLDLLDGEFRPEVYDPIIDEAAGGFAPASSIAAMKQFLRDRSAAVRAQIPQTFTAATDLSSTPEGYVRTATGAASFSGTFHAARTRSVTLNGQEASLDPRAGTWSFTASAGDGFLAPGLSRVTIIARDADGAILSMETIDVLRDGAAPIPISGTLLPAPLKGSLKIVAPASYVPGVPVLVRVDLIDEDGNLIRHTPDRTLALSAPEPGVILSPNTLDLRNGRGSALVEISSAAGGGAGTVLIPTGSAWRYLDDGSNQGTAWRQPGFDDAGWNTGPAELGYGDGDEATVVGFGPNFSNKFITTYFRRTFEVADPAALAAVRLRVKRDDGVVVYINGAEAARDNLPANPSYNTPAANGSAEENIFLEFSAPASLLVAGTNTIAAEVHQSAGTSADMSFDLELTALDLATDPGDITLAVSGNGLAAAAGIVSLGSQAPTQVSGTLTGSATWSGVVHVTGDVTVPPGAELSIEPGTIVLLSGTSAPRSAAGADIIVQGSMGSTGTRDAPVTITAADPDAPWGQIRFENTTAPSTLTFTHITRGGHAPGEGHTGHGPVIRLAGADVSFTDCTLTDHAGKVGQCEAGVGDSSLTLTRCHLGRAVMGFETENTSVLVDDCHLTDMLGIYREDGVTDDNDGIYLHDGPDTLVVRDTVVAFCDDDGIDTLGADVLLENIISRSCFDKGISQLGGTSTIRRALVFGNDIGISGKNGAQIEIEHATIASNATIALENNNKTGIDLPSWIRVVNSIVVDGDPIRTDYDPSADPSPVVIRYSLAGEAWPYPGSGNLISGAPMFLDAASGDFRLGEGSPAIDAGDPASPSDPDLTPADLGVFPYLDGDGEEPPTGEVLWTAAGGPYHLTDDVTVAVGTVLRIEPGAIIYVSQNSALNVAGTLLAIGSENARIQFAPLPGAPFVPDPAGNGTLPPGPPKWAGIRLVDSMDPENIIRHVDIAHAQNPEGSISVIRSAATIEDVTFRGTHYRMIYTDTASVDIVRCRFPDMFAPGEKADALGLDNISEHIKGIGGIAPGGRYIIRENHFGTNRGHNDCIDVDSGRYPEPLVQILDNTFTGAGDEHLDLGGDVYVAGNDFQNIFKDDETSDRGYANAISTGDAGTETTIVVARNVFRDVDHAINLKRGTVTIFEHNTVHLVHDDFIDRFGNPNVGSVINLFVDEPFGTPGDGAYAAGNIFSSIPRVFGNADLPGAGRVTPLQFEWNMLDPAAPDLSPGRNHAGQTVMDLGAGNQFGSAAFIDAGAGDLELSPGSPARGMSRQGRDLGAFVPSGVWISGEPETLTASTSAALTVGGPGIFAFRWRLDGGPWSADLPIGDGFDAAGTVRTAQIVLNGLADGIHVVDVSGKTFAGDWQDPPAASRSWTVDSSMPARLRLSEALASNAGSFVHEGTLPDFIEIENTGAAAADLTGFRLTDSSGDPNRFVFPAGVTIPAGGRLVVFADAGDAGTSGLHAGFALDADGEEIVLLAPAASGGAVVDRIEFGRQIADFSIGRLGPDALWALNIPTPGAPNAAALTGNPRSVRINEWLASGKVAVESDFIELFNPDSRPVNIGAMYLSANPATAPFGFQIPALSFIRGGGVTVFFRGGGRDEFPFGLADRIGQLALLAPDGIVLDAAVYGPQAPDHSSMREGSVFTAFRMPTPGLLPPAPGSPEEPPFLNALAIFDSLRITEIMYDPQQGTDFEFVELTNLGAVPISLDGVAFVKGIDFTFGAVTLAPGEFVLVVRNRTAFESLYGAGANIAGEYSGRLDNGGEPLALQLPPPFRAAIVRFTYDDEWHPEADGGGRSLVVSQPAAPVQLWSDRSLWSASPEIGGSPDGRTLQLGGIASWLTAHGVTGIIDDDDGDGIPHLVEYGTGRRPDMPDSDRGTTAVNITPEGELEVVFETADPLPADVRVTVEFGDGSAWSGAASRSGSQPWSAFVPGVSVSTTPGPQDRTTVTLTLPPSSASREFVRTRFDLIAP